MTDSPRSSRSGWMSYTNWELMWKCVTWWRPEPEGLVWSEATGNNWQLRLLRGTTRPKPLSDFRDRSLGLVTSILNQSDCTLNAHQFGHRYRFLPPLGFFGGCCCTFYFERFQALHKSASSDRIHRCSLSINCVDSWRVYFKM